MSKKIHRPETPTPSASRGRSEASESKEPGRPVKPGVGSPGKATATPRSASAKKSAKKAAKKAAKKGKKPRKAVPRAKTADREDIYQFADRLDATGKRHETETPVEEPTDSWVTFQIGTETFGLPVETVTEVMRVPEITRVPHAPDAVRGVTSRRGRVLPVIDLSLRLRLPQAQLGETSRIVVVDDHGRFIGLLVESVRQLESVLRSEIQPPPDDAMTEQSHYLKGVCHLHNRLLVLLDLSRVVEVESALASNAKGG